MRSLKFTRYAVIALTAASTVAVSPTLSAQSLGRHRSPDRAELLAREIFKELIEINTAPAGGSTRAAEAMAARLRAAGFPDDDIHLVGPVPEKMNLVARYRGRTTGKKPLLLLAHLDVVDANPADWTLDPFKFTDRDGFFYGRGTTDDKDEAAIWVANLIRLRQEGYTPDRDIIVALTADEEGGDHNGVEWLLQHRRDLVDAAFALNEGGGGVIKDGRRLSNNVQASEKVYQSFRLEATNKGGHSSLPRADNAIYQLTAALNRIAEYRFPVRLNEVTRAFFERTAAIETPEVAAAMRGLLRTPPDPAAVERLSVNPAYNSRLRTTCVATMLEGGHAENALPQRARAVVNCRILPGESPDEVLATLRRVVNDPGVSVTPVAPAKPSPPSPLTPEILRGIEETTEEMWPGVPVIPTMSTGATDGLYLRQAGIPVYGVSGVFGDEADVRAHGQDERIRHEWFFEGLEFCYRLIKRLTAGEVM
ncbi:MAG TPA: M20/M25/M40 family metallo-hydrolase [Gemmatimonadales bacterium]|nr:M20/M25/M40 family metallo-hydrolase [Gemmatimonadales bacterium]